MKRLIVFIFFLVALALSAPAQTASDLNEGSTLARDPATGAFTFSWWGRAGTTYFIQHTDNLATWSYVPIFETGNDEVIQWGFTSTANQFFLRLEIHPDGGLLPDGWQLLYFGHTGVDPYADDDGDGITNLQEFLNGTDPTDYYNGQTPTLAIVSGNNQTGNPSGFVPQALLVAVSDGSGNPLSNAPVTFTVTQGGGTVQKTNITTPGTTITVNADSWGQVKVYFKLPNTTGSTNQITATAGSGSHTASAIFTESSDTGGGTYRDPFDPSDIVATLNFDGSVDVSWTNNTDPNDVEPINIQFRSPNGGWVTAVTVPAGTSSYHVPPQ